ncbi:MAG TPA: hypothetical protein VGG13_03300 [Candidatus Saccharimonadales bacterium]|jgi:hypothetical protein
MTGDDARTQPEVQVSWQFKPGDTLKPDTVKQPQVPTENVAAVAPLAQTQVVEPIPDESSLPGDAGQAQVAPESAPATDSVGWTASEFIAHEKGAGWYLALVLATAALTAIIYLLTKDKISSGVVVIAAIIFGVYAGRKPRTLAYRLDDSGLTVADKFYDYGQFRSFVVIGEGAFRSITFMPLKRFMPALTIYYAPEDEQKITDLLADQLPMESRGHDPLDRFLHRIRF